MTTNHTLPKTRFFGLRTDGRTDGRTDILIANIALHYVARLKSVVLSRRLKHRCDKRFFAIEVSYELQTCSGTLIFCMFFPVFSKFKKTCFLVAS